MEPKFLYNTGFGRAILKILTMPAISKIAGKYMDSSLSKRRISKFIAKNNIDMSDYPEKEYKSFNDFFTRELKEDARYIDKFPLSFISPCDGKISAYTINPDSTFNIKDSVYTVEELVQNKDIADEYNGGLMIVLRLTVTDYHRYIYLDDGTKDENIFIQGILHTVQPIAQTKYKIYKTNSREYTILHTRNFKDIVQMEVGAMMVGKISNLHGEHSFRRGEEKGKFEFGGSTIVLLVKKDTVNLRSDIPLNSQEELQTRMGEVIGEKYM